MLSRHLYEIDEIIAALMWSCKQRRILEVAFWLQELIDTQMLEELYRALYTFWIWQIGIARLDLFKELYDLFHREEETTFQDILQLALKMASTKPTERDNSIFVLLVLGTQDTSINDRTGELKLLISFFDELQATDVEKTFLRACYQGKVRLAWYLACALWKENPERVWFILHRFIEGKHPSLVPHLQILQQDECGLTWEVKAASICIACLPLKYRIQEYTNIPISQEIEEALKSWASIEGRRKRRLYAIPHECLYYITSRGCLSNKKRNLRKVYCGSYEDLRGSPYWDSMLDQIQPWSSDEQLELFWDTLFPDDIPDEWSLEDQMKSHGYGVLINQEKPNYTKFAEKWFRSNSSRLLWLGSTMAFQLLIQKGSTFTSWDTMYNTKTYSISQDSLKPVVKKLEDITSSVSSL